MEARELAQFLRFLQDELKISEAGLELALKHPEQTLNLLPMILWQYGLVSLTEVNCMFDWLENRISIQIL